MAKDLWSLKKKIVSPTLFLVIYITAGFYLKTKSNTTLLADQELLRAMTELSGEHDYAWQSPGTWLGTSGLKCLMQRMSRMHALVLKIPFTGAKRSRHVPARQCPCAKVKSRKTWFDKVGLKELKCPAQRHNLNPSERLWDELVCQQGLLAQQQYLTSLKLLWSNKHKFPQPHSKSLVRSYKRSGN